MRRSIISLALLSALLAGCGSSGHSKPKLATQTGAGTYPPAFRAAVDKTCGKEAENFAREFGGETICGCIARHIEEDIPADNFMANEESGFVDDLIKEATKTCIESSSTSG